MPDASGKESHPYHRRFIRHKVRLKVEVEAGKSYGSWTNNVSEDGVCFEIEKQLAVGSEATVWVYIYRGKQRPVRAQCRIVWKERSKKRTRHGARFLSFAVDGLERIRDYLAELSRPVSQPPPP